MLVWLAYTMTAVAGDGLNLHKRGFWPLPQSLLHQAALWNLLAVVILLINKFLVIGIWEAIYTYHTILVYCLPNILGHFCNEMWSLLSNLRHVLHTQCVKGGGVRKMFFSETTKGLFWSIGSSYWMFNLEVHVSVTGNKIMAKKQPFLAIFGNIWP